MAPERPRRKPQVFPKSHFPQRRFAYFAAVGKVGRRRSGETSLLFQDISPCGASFFLSDQKETKESPGASFVRKALRLRLALSLTIPPDPRFTGEPEGGAGNSGRRGTLMKGV